MSLWPAPKQPPTGLGKYRVLSRIAGVHVSPLALGAMSIGDKWESIGMGSMNKESSFKLLDAYFEAGGNFIDTANNYQNESSEEFVGEWAESKGIRDQLFIATKFTTNFKNYDDNGLSQKVLYGGNNMKSLHLSVKASLKKLRTDYIDLLYVHWWDYDTSVEEVMNGLHHLVASGKVLYLGVSDTPAWIVAQANQYARDHGKTPFVIYQGAWNVMERSFERDIIPMARKEGMALAPWNVIGGGKLRSDEEEQKRRETGENGRAWSGSWERNENEVKMSRALEKIAQEVGTKHITAVAIAYVMQKTPYVFPLLGGRKVEHLMANVEALDIVLTPEHMKAIESVFEFNPGFPNWMIGDGTEYNQIMASPAHLVKQPLQSPIKPTKD